MLTEAAMKPVVFYVYLTVKTKEHYGEQLAYHKWENLTLEQLMRWQWYFRYRAALYQVKYPKASVKISEFKKEAESTQLQNAYYTRWVAKKRKITEWKNRIAKAEAEYKELFPIATHPVYQKAVQKLKRLEEEFVELNELYMYSLIK